jgi:glucose-1-phosphate thymidylyltransferase
MKGIILAGGSGTRLHPTTKVVNKHLLMVYDKPMIYFPLATLISAKIDDILIITTPQDIELFRVLLGDGSQWAIKISYAIQEAPNGLAEAFIIGEEFIGASPVTLILGDNVFHGDKFPSMITHAMRRTRGSIPHATIFGYTVKDPSRYGVIEYSEDGKIVGIVEKPENPESNQAVVGVYCYPNSVVQMAKEVQPSARGEKEITTINNMYLDMGILSCASIDQGVAWLDTGNFASMLQASVYVQTIQDRTGIIVGSPDHTARCVAEKV